MLPGLSQGLLLPRNRNKTLTALDAQGKLDWSQTFLDGSFVPEKRGERISPLAGKAKVARSTW